MHQMGIPLRYIPTGDDFARCQLTMTSTEPTSTKSEMLFELLCRNYGIVCTPIVCAGKKADYEIAVKGHRIITEIKQIDPTEADEATWNKGRLRVSAAAWGNSEHRIRLKIQEARKQLKARSNEILPTLLIVYDNGTFAGTDVTDVKTAMFGDEKVVVSHLNYEVASVSPIHAGGNRRFTPDSNTSISAIGLMYKEQPRLTIFHNHFATNPIDPEWLRFDGIRHYALNSQNYEWMER